MQTWFFDGRTASGIGSYLEGKGYADLGTAPLSSTGEFPAHLLTRGRPQPGDIIFAHHGTWDGYAKKNPEIVVILVTTQATGMSFGQNYWNLVGCEFAFPPNRGDRVEKLLDILASKQRPTSDQWGLLKRVEYPERLLAAYLVRLAQARLGNDEKASLDTVLTDDQWKQAGDELRKWGGGVDGDPKNIDLERIRKVLADSQVVY